MVEDVVAVETADAVEDEAAVALETVGAAAADVVEEVEEVEEVLAALLTGAVGASFLAQAAAKQTIPAITATRTNDEDLMDSRDMVLILPCFSV
ncbi:MAG: hypothetical protein ACYCUJ_08770 [Acidithiobacillus sp.]